MSFDIGPRIGIEGDKEYKKSIREIETGMKVLTSEMQAATSSFDKNEKSVQSLTARSDVLTKQVDLQKQKVAQLRDALKNSAATYGENDTATQNWQIKLNKAVAELNDLEKESKDVNGDLRKMKLGMDESGDSADKAGGKFDKLGGILKGIGVAMGTAVAAAGAAAVKLGAEVVKQFGELEQNLGGSEAVFGEYAKSIQKTGEDAYKSMGVSQSQYLATANKMGALFQGSGVDQRKSLELTEKAMQRAADMASVMGIDMQMALDSVAGAAKGNFTMMDNLGVAMNATNIEAYALAKGLDFTWKTATQAEKAEVAMQMFFENTEQYAGNFAKESTETVTGSLGLLKAALGSFTAGLGNAGADMGNLTKNLTDAFGAVVENIVPVIKNLAKALPQAVDAILKAAETLLPELLTVFQDLFAQVLKSLLGMLPNIIPGIISAVLTLADTIIDNLPLLVSAAVNLVVALVQGISQALPQLIPAAVDAILTIVEGLIENLPMLIDAAIDLVLALVDGILNALPMLLARAPEIIRTLIDGIVKAIPKLVDAAIDIIMAIVDFLLDPDNLYMLIKASFDIIVALAAGLIRAIPELLKAIPKIIKRLIEKFKETDWGEIGKNILSGIADGLTSGVKNLVGTVKKVAGQIADGFKNFFGIQSPSKLMREDVGKMLGFGMADGIEQSMKRVNSAMSAMNNQVMASAPVIGKPASSETNTVNNYNTYGPARYETVLEMNGREVGRAVSTDVSRNFGDTGFMRTEAFGTA